MRLLSSRRAEFTARPDVSRLAATGRRLKTLLSGDAGRLAADLEAPGTAWPLACVGVIVVGGGLYGATLGGWRAPLQAVFTAAKFPLLVLLTCGGNALLNGLLAQVLGLGISVRQSTLTILMSFALMAMVLAALSPVMLFLLLNTPPLSAGPSASHSLLLTTHVAVIAFAGVVANRRLLRLLVRLTGRPGAGRAILCAWLTGNLLLGSQLAWVLRPFVGSPGLPIQFLRPDPLHGNFFESVAHALRHLLF